MKTSKHTPLGATLVILNKVHIYTRMSKKALGIERLKEVSPLVTKNLRLKDEDIFDMRSMNYHRPASFSRYCP